MQPLKTLTILEILPLLKKYLGVTITKTTIYSFIKTKNFPHNTGLGRPRRWSEVAVKKWIEKQIKQNRG